MWWATVGLACGLIAVYIALRLYINAILVKEAKFSLILKKLQQEADAIVTEFNRITDRNITIVEENAVKLKKLIDQSHKYLTHLSEKHVREDPSPTSYSPQTVHSRSAAQHVQLESTTDSAIHAQIVQLLHDNVDPEEIALQVGVSVSEVETVSLMLNR